MLVLKRNVDQVVQIGPDITVMVTEVGDGWVKLGFNAPPDVAVHRSEIYDAIRRGDPRPGGFDKAHRPGRTCGEHREHRRSGRVVPRRDGYVPGNGAKK